MNRRNFLTGAVAACILPVLPKAAIAHDSGVPSFAPESWDDYSWRYGSDHAEILHFPMEPHEFIGYREQAIHKLCEEENLAFIMYNTNADSYIGIFRKQYEVREGWDCYVAYVTPLWDVPTNESRTVYLEIEDKAGYDGVETLSWLSDKIEEIKHSPTVVGMRLYGPESPSVGVDDDTVFI